MTSPIEQWEAGDLTDQTAYNMLVSEREEIDDVYQRAKSALDGNRADIERVVSHAGGKLSGGGYEASIVGGGKSVSFDSKALDSLIAELLAAGDMFTAGKIAAARKETERSGYLRISRTK